ncbi:MAG: hypothetical protein ACK2TT_04285 [Anaerolineales bacterium]
MKAMKTEYLPYYLSRAVLSLLLAVVVFGVNWVAGAAAAVLFGLFLLYLHSGWFEIDLNYPFFPLRRDQRGRDVQRLALIAAVCTALLVGLAIKYLAAPLGLALSQGLALPLAVLAYFFTQWILLARG